MTDSEIWEAISKSDITAFNLLFERYWSKVFGTAFSLLKDREVSIEIVHDIFLNLWLKRDKLKIGSFSGYLTSSARYHVYRHVKESKTRKLEYVDNWDLVKSASNFNDGYEKIRSAELESMVEGALTKLPKRCREIFYLSRKENLSNDQIAQNLGISKRTVENQITSALRYLRVYSKDLYLILILMGYLK
jgi:RNA polymerase sigma-70 factor (family 1)